MGVLDGLAGGLISGIGSLVGGGSQNDANRKINSENNAFNAAQAQINRDFQTQMSNTAYQRSSEDMKKAGLNPMMMMGGAGGAASSPSGSAASAASPIRMEDTLSKGISSAAQNSRLLPELQNLLEQNKNTSSDTAVKTAQALNIAKDTEIKGHTAQKTKVEKQIADANLKLIQNTLPKSETSSKVATGINNLVNDLIPAVSSAYGKAKDFVNRTWDEYKKPLPSGTNKKSYYDPLGLF